MTRWGGYSFTHDQFVAVKKLKQNGGPRLIRKGAAHLQVHRCRSETLEEASDAVWKE